MSFRPCTRSRVPSVRCLLRRSITQRRRSEHAPTPKTSATSTSIESHCTLPPSKMRALISLYHQADNWITPEKLLDRIDAAFVPVTSSHLIALPAQEGISLDELKSTAKNIKRQPRMAQVEAEDSFRRLGSKGSGLAQGLSFLPSQREKKMIEALYGVNLSGKDVRPGWEVLKEMTDGLRKSNEEDRAREQTIGGNIGDLLERKD